MEGFAMVTTGGLIGFLRAVFDRIYFEKPIFQKAVLLILLTLVAAFAAWKNKFLINKEQLKQELPYDEQLY